MDKLILLPLLSLFVFSNLNAQNYIFEEGQSGFSLSGFYSTATVNKRTNSTYGFTPMYTINGRYTFGLSIYKNSSEDESGTAFTPTISYVFLKIASDSGTLNIGVFGSYSFESYDAGKINTSGIGPSLNYQFKLNEGVKLSIGGRYLFGNIKVTPKNSDVSASIDQNAYGFSANLLLNKFYFEPSIAMADREGNNHIAYGVTLGYIF